MGDTIATARTIGLGCMRLSTLPERDAGRGVAVIHAALDAGVALLDTADAYALDEHDMGHNERLVAGALASWTGNASGVTVATKAGLRRSGGAWIPDGRARHLRAACEASLAALGVTRIALFQLHAVDPRTPLSTSVRALAALQRQGMIERIGLCNVNVSQIEAARSIADIASVQVAMSVLDDTNERNGVAEYCRAHGLMLIAHRPLAGVNAGPRLRRRPGVATVAERHGVSPETVALAWLMHRGAIPIPGATRVATAAGLAEARALSLTDQDIAALSPRRRIVVPVHRDVEVVVVMGMPGAGKSSVAHEFVENGAQRLNRDEAGGTLAQLAQKLDNALDKGQAVASTRWVLDNTYATRASRNRVIEAAAHHGVPVRCIHLGTGIADAQINAVNRMLDANGSLPTPEDIARLSRHDTRYMLPSAQFRYERELEPPVMEEGFASIERRAFERRADPARTGRAFFFDVDALRSDDVLRRYHEEGWRLLGIAWRPKVSEGTTSHEAVVAEFVELRARVGVPIEVEYCPHAAGPPACWCRKPLPGVVLGYCHRYGIDPARSMLLGGSQADRTLATRLGLALVSPTAPEPPA